MPMRVDLCHKQPGALRTRTYIPRHLEAIDWNVLSSH